MGTLNAEFLKLIHGISASSEVELTEDLIGDAITEALPKISERLLQELHKDAPEMLFWERHHGHGFCERLIHRWQEGFDLLDMLGVICLETGEMVVRDVSPELKRSETPRFESLSRLHARACLIFGEIVCLLKSGYADGALARWRALHEIAVVALFIAENPVNLSVRFLDHRHIECWRRMQKYQDHCKRLGCEPYSDAEMNNAEQVANALKEKYGHAFERDYGWAAEALDSGNPKFTNLEIRVGIQHLRPYYQWACERIHASSNGLYRTLGLVNSEDLMLAGPSNAGLADPAQLAAISLHQATTALQVNYPDMDFLVAISVAQRVVAQIQEVFVRIQGKLEEEEESNRRNS